MRFTGKISRKNNAAFSFLVAASFLFISVFAVNTKLLVSVFENKSPKNENENTLGVSIENNATVSNVFPPELVGSQAIELSAKSVLAVDLESGAILFEKNSQDPVMPASTAKVLTALVSLDAYDLNQKLTVPRFSVEGQKIGLKAGEQLKFEDVLYALLVASANDAAEVLARNYPGGREIFIANMNIKAKNLGLKNSVFLNPTGLDEIGQVTTSQDMVKAAFYAMQNPVFEKIVATKKYTIFDDDGNVIYRFTNINQLLGEVEGVKGVKTGKTDGAMENLVTYIDRGNSKVLTAILGSTDRFGETKELINWIFNNYSWVK